MSLLDKSISQLNQLIESNESTSEDITKACIENIEEEDFKTILKDEAIRSAKEIDSKRKSEKLNSLSGIPVVITDDISTKGILTTAGSKILEKYIPPFNATVIDRLLEENSVVIGKTKVNEFGLDYSNTISKALNSKSAVYGLSTSMESNKISMKPTYGLVSRYGVIGATSSFDQVVPVTNCVEDLAIVLNAIVGFDKRDSASIKIDNVDYRKSLTSDIKGIKVAVPADLASDEKISKVVSELENHGCTVNKVSLDTSKYIFPAYRILSSAEFASNTSKFDGISLGYRTEEYSDIDELYKKTRAEGFSKEAKKYILFGNYVVSAGQYEKLYKQAQKIRTMIKEEFSKVCNEYGLIILPYEDEIYKLASNMTGLPAITIPNGLQFIGPAYGEEELISLAYILENAFGNEWKQGGAM